MSKDYKALMQALLDNNPDIEPTSDVEEYLMHAIQSSEIEDLEDPTSRIEAYLGALIARLKQGGSGSGGTLEESAEDDIPKVFFGGALQQTKDEAVVPFRYISKTQDVSGYAEIKAQGNSSMSYPKKNQTVKLYKDAACEEKLKIDFKEWGKQSKFCFKANWIDLTHARNVVSARLWADVVKSRSNYEELPELLRTSPNQGAVDGFPVKVYADGVYQGRYTVNIPKDAWMANMDDELDNHCILCGENYVSGCFRASANINGSDWTDEIHKTVPASIKTRWNEVISFVRNSTDEDFKANLGNYFYVDSLIDYYLFGLVSCGLDAFGKNQLYMTYDGQKWIATMYDMDSTWGLYWNGSKFVTTDYARTSYEDYVHTDGNLLYNRLEAMFGEELKARWAELRNGAMSIDSIVNRFERFTDIAPAELVKEDFASTTGGGKFTGIPSQSTNNIQQIRAFALARLAWTDEYVAALTGGEVEPDEPDEPNELPPEYTQLEYIQSDGNQYIDTGVSGGTNAAWEIKMNALAAVATNYEMYICGDKNGAIPNLHCNTNTMTMCSNNANSTSNKLNGLDYNDHTYEYRGTKNVYVDGEPYSVLNDPTGNGWGTSTWYVFNSHGEPGLKSSMRLYYLKMWTDGVLVRDFVPAVRNSDNSRGLYDLANDVFYGNIGTGTFLIPDEVEGETGTKLIYNMPEATTFNGNSDYIDTGIQLMSTAKNMVICIDCDFTAGLPDGAAIFHCMTESSPYNGIVLSIISDGKYSVAQQNKRIRDIPTGRRKIVVACVAGCMSNVKYSDGGIIKTINGGGTYMATDKNLLIGCYQDTNGNKGRFWTGTIYDFKVYEGGMTEDEIAAYLIGTDEPDEPDEPVVPDEPESISPVWSDTPTYGIGKTNGADLASGSDYVTNHFKVPEGETRVKFENAIGASYTWLTVYTYDENKAWVRTVGAAAGTEAAVLNVGNTEKYLRLSAFPNNVSTNNDPENQLIVTFAKQPDEPTGSLLYSLPEETIFTGTNYIDTGVNLNVGAYTVLVDFSGVVSGENNTLVDNMTESNPYPGWAIDVRGDTSSFSAKSRLINSFTNVDRNKVVVRKTAEGEVTLFTDSVYPTGTYVTSHIASGDINHTVYLGAYYNNGNIIRYATATMHDCKIYDYAMSDDEIAAYLIGAVEPDEPVVPDEPTDGLLYSLPEVTTFDGVDDYIDTGVKLFDTNKDFTVTFEFMDAISEAPAMNIFVLHSCNEVNPWPGFSIVCRQNETVYKLNNYNIGIAVPMTKKRRVVITKDAAKNTITATTSSGTGKIVGSGATTVFSQNVILGAGDMGTAGIGHFWAGTIYQCNIYLRKFSDTEIADYLAGE